MWPSIPARRPSSTCAESHSHDLKKRTSLSGWSAFLTLKKDTRNTFRVSFRQVRSGQVIQRVLCHAVVPNLKVAVVAGGVAGGTHPGNLLSFVHMVAHGYQ